LTKHSFEIVESEVGSNGWIEPSNIFVIARKRIRVNNSSQLPEQSAEQVLQMLKTYRLWWNTIGAPRWYTYRAGVELKRGARRLARQLIKARAK
jgi:hypothetical protein